MCVLCIITVHLLILEGFSVQLINSIYCDSRILAANFSHLPKGDVLIGYTAASERKDQPYSGCTIYHSYRHFEDFPRAEAMLRL